MNNYLTVIQDLLLTKDFIYGCVFSDKWTWAL